LRVKKALLAYTKQHTLGSTKSPHIKKATVIEGGFFVLNGGW